MWTASTRLDGPIYPSTMYNSSKKILFTVSESSHYLGSLGTHMAKNQNMQLNRRGKKAKTNND